MRYALVILVVFVALVVSAFKAVGCDAPTTEDEVVRMLETLAKGESK